MQANPNGVLYCARGGLRSQLTQEWLAEAGVECPKVEGGYKSLRGFLYQYLMDYCANNMFTIVSGMTGTGKTEIIQDCPTGLILRARPITRARVLGGPLDEQPAQIDFENRIAIDLLKVEDQHPDRWWYLKMKAAILVPAIFPIILPTAWRRVQFVVIDMDFEERLERLWQEYVSGALSKDHGVFWCYW